MTTPVAVSVPGGISCAHCGGLIAGSGVIGPWVLRPCSSRECRDGHDGAWNLVVRLENLALSVALPRRFAQSLVGHLSGEDAKELTQLAAAAGAWWRGPMQGIR